MNENTHVTVVAHKTLSHFSALIYTLNCDKAILSKCVRNSMLLSLLHCIYICMKKSIYSRLTSNLLISFLILPTQEGSCLRESMYCLISYAISSLASCSLVLSTFFSWSHLQYIYLETKFLILDQHLYLWTHFMYIEVNYIVVNKCNTSWDVL